MTITYTNFLGIDVSKDKLDIFYTKTGELKEIPNTKKDIENYAKTLKPTKDLLVVIDLTGGYEQKAVDVFYQLGFCVHRAEGRRVKFFSHSMGQYAKTDPMDAKNLATYGEKMQDNLKLYMPVDVPLLEIASRLFTLKSIIKEERNRLHAPKLNKEIQEDIMDHIKYLDKKILKYQKKLKEIILSNPIYKRKYNILINIKGVGDITAFTLLATLPEIGDINRRQITALAGVAPYARDSGTLSAHRFVRHGRPMVKPALFMAAMVAMKYNPKISAFYKHLTEDSGKPKMVALVACMRKILIIAHTQMQQN